MIKQEPQHHDTISKIAYKEYFLPLHQEIGEVLKHKIYLLEGNTIPESVRKYFKHFTSENLYWRLTEEEKLTSSVKASDFPEDFPQDMQINLDNVINRYESALQELRHGIPLYPSVDFPKWIAVRIQRAEKQRRTDAV